MAPGTDRMDSGRAVAGPHVSGHCVGGPLPDGSWTQWDQLGQRGHKGGHCDMEIAVDKKCDVWTILKCEKEKRRRLDLKGRAPARGGRSPWLCMVGASMSRDLSGGVSQEVVQTQDAPENSMRKVRGRAGAGRLQVPALHPALALALIFSD